MLLRFGTHPSSVSLPENYDNCWQDHTGIEERRPWVAVEIVQEGGLCV